MDDQQARDQMIEGLKVAMLGTTDGDFIDPNSEIPAGEMFRLAAEYLAALPVAPLPPSTSGCRRDK